MVQLIPEGIRRMVSRETAPSLGHRNAVVVSVCAQKGGVGKTTTAVNLACALASAHQRRVLLVDMDSQGHVTSSLHGVLPPALAGSVSEILLAKRRDLSEIARATSVDGLDATPSDKHLNETESIIGARIGKEFLLRQAMRTARTHYDFIVLDCPPNLGNLTLNALLASQYALVPSDMSVLSLEGVHDILDAIVTINERLGHDLRLLGLLRTRVDGRNRSLNDSICDVMERDYAELLLETQIPINTALSKAQLAGRPVFEHAPRSTGAQAYRALAAELLARLEMSA